MLLAAYPERLNCLERPIKQAELRIGAEQLIEVLWRERFTEPADIRGEQHLEIVRYIVVAPLDRVVRRRLGGDHAILVSFFLLTSIACKLVACVGQQSGCSVGRFVETDALADPPCFAARRKQRL